MKKQKKHKPAESWRVIDVPIWKCQVAIIVGSLDFLKRTLRDSKWDMTVFPPDSDFAKAEAMTIHNGGNGSVVIYSRNPINTPVLVHELFHATIAIMRANEVNDDEAVAYTMEYLYKEATK